MKAKGKEKNFAKVVYREGNEIVIPEGMTLETASSLVHQKWAETDSYLVFTEEFSVIPYEGAAALQAALTSLYEDVWKGLESSVVNLEVDVGKTVAVPWGQFEVPGVEGYFETRMKMNETGTVVFMLKAQIKRQYEPHFHKIVKKMHSLLAKGKLYKGKAFQIQFRDPEGRPVGFLSPEMLDVAQATMPLFNEDTKYRLEVEVFGFLTKTALMRKYNIPLKRGVLMAATYGMGKTLLGRYIAKVAIQNGWTYIYVPSAAELPEAYMLARQYMPAVVFVEDINRVVGSSRTAEVDRVLNTLDGVGSKEDEIVVMMTTNESQQINPALLRPGRVDSIIRIEWYDLPVIEELLRLYADDLLADGCKLSRVAKKLEGQTGARIAHVVQTAKHYAVYHLTSEDDTLRITEENLLNAAEASILEAKKVADEHVSGGIPFPVALAMVLSTLVQSGDISIATMMPHPNGNGETVH